MVGVGVGATFTVGLVSGLGLCGPTCNIKVEQKKKVRKVKCKVVLHVGVRIYTTRR